MLFNFGDFIGGSLRSNICCSRRDSIDKYFKGGWVRFQQNIPNSTMCTDGELVRVGFMSPNAVQEYVESLEASGLQFKEEKKFLGVFGKGRSENDIVVVDQRSDLLSHAIGLNLAFPLAKRSRYIDVLVI